MDAPIADSAINQYPYGIILIALALYFQFGSAHMAKGYPRKIPGFRHSQREQNEQGRLDASRVGLCTPYMGMSYPGSSASGQESRLWDAERFYLPTARRHGQLYCSFLSEEPVLRIFTILKLTRRWSA